MDISRLVTRELSIVGTQGYCHDFATAISAAASIPLKKLVTHTFPLEQLDVALKTVMDRKNESIKAIIHP